VVATCHGEPPTGSSTRPSSLALVSGHEQTGIAGQVLAERLFVQVSTEAGQGVPGVRVQWAVAAGGGSLSASATDADGQGRASVAWTLGRTAGSPQSVTASVSGLSGSPVTFTATAVPGPPAKLSVSAGDSQSATVNTLVPIAPAVLVQDINDNAVPEAAVTFAVTGGGGSVTGAAATTGSGGVATVGGWTLGTMAGANTLSATVGALPALTFFARGTAAAPDTVYASAGDGQSAVAGEVVATPPAVVVRDTFGNGVPNVAVTFAVDSGGGSVTGGAATTDSLGVARVTSWRLGTSAGVNTLTAAVSDLPLVTFTARGLAGAPAAVTVSAGNGQSATVGTAVAVAPAARVADANDNPIFGVSVTFAVASGGGTVTGEAASTDSSGIARAGSWTLGTTAGANTLTATVSGLPEATFSATGTPGAPVTMSVSAGDGQSATVNTAVATAPAVVVSDQYGNGVPGVEVTFAVASGGGAASGATAVTAASGVAAVGSWTLGVTAGTNTLTASASGLASVTFSATGTPDAAASAVLFSGDNQSATVGTAVPVSPSVLVRDQYGNPVPGVTVTFAVTSGGGTATGAAPLTNSSGVASVGSWILGPLTGANTLTATVSPLSVSFVFAAVGTVGAAATITVAQGNNQSATVGTAVAVAPAVVVRDANGNLVAGVAVSFTVTGGGGSVTGGAAVTDSLGLAMVGSWTLGTAVGANTLSATAGTLAAASFTATALVGAPASVGVSAGNAQSVAAGTAVSDPPAVVVLDQYGNPVPGVVVTFSVAPGHGTLTGETATTDLTGVARVGSWTLGTEVGADTLTVTASPAGLAGNPVIFTATATAGAPASVTVYAGAGQTATAGSAVAINPAVRVVDANGNPVAGASVSFAVTSGGGTIVGSPATTGADGVATAGAWTLGVIAGANALSATVAGVSASFTATGTPGAPATVVAVAGDAQAATAGSAVGVSPSVRVRDSNGNAVPNVSVTFAIGSGGGSLTGATPTTDATGLAAVGSWTLGTTAGTNTLVATVASLPSVTFSATGQPGSSSSLTLVQGDDQVAQVNTAVAVAPVFVVRDANANAVPGATVTFAVSDDGSVSPASAVTDAGGFASVSTWTLGSTATAITLTATVQGTAVSAVAEATATAGPPATLVADAPLSQSATVATNVADPPRVRVLDADGNPVQDQSVTFSVTFGGGSANNQGAVVSVASDADGYATLNSWTLGTIAGTNTLSASVPGRSPVVFSATGLAGPAAAAAVSAGNNQSATVGTAVAVAPAVVVSDQYGNPVAGVGVAFAVASGGGSVGGAAAVTNASGVAAAGSWTLGPVAGSNALSATVDGAGISGNPVPFAATGLAGAAASVTVSAGDGQTAVAGTALPTPPAVLVRDANNNAVGGVEVGWSVTAGGGSVASATSVTDASGLASVGWTLGAVAGSNALSASVGALTPATFTATGTAGAAASLSIVAGNGQSATVGTAVATNPRVVVRDANGNAVPGVTVTFAAPPGSGSVAGAGQTTDAAGEAAVGQWTLGTDVSTDTLTASVTGVPAATFTATAQVGPPASLGVSAGDGQTATVNTSLATAPQVAVRDAFANPVPGVVVSFTVASGGGSVTGGVDTTDAAGLASVGAWTMGTVAGTNTLTAAASGLSPVTFTATGSPGAAASVSINAGNNQIEIVNEPVPIRPSVVVRDSFNNPVPGIEVTFQVGLGGGALTGSVQTTSASGIATVGSWELGRSIGPNSLNAVVSGLPQATFTATGAGGGLHSCEGEPAGALCWGFNGSGQLGDGTTQNRQVPTPVVVSEALIQTNVGGQHSCGLTASGAAYCWGNNFHGQLGDGTTTNRTGPVAVAGGLSFVQISAGFFHTCAVTAAGEGWCWGRNGFGQLGDGTTLASSQPVLVTGGLFLVEIETGWNHTCAREDSGVVYCWGNNQYGQLGVGTTATGLLPTPVAVPGPVISLAAGGGHTCGVVDGGAAYCWGNNRFGQIGDNTSQARSTPTAVAGGISFANVNAGFYGTCAETAAGEAYCWGRNDVGQLGDGTLQERRVPTAVSGGLVFSSISLGVFHSCGRTSDGAYYCWGGNGFGQVGDGTFTDRLTPVLILPP
jgi:adhesin/invasin